MSEWTCGECGDDFEVEDGCEAEADFADAAQPEDVICPDCYGHGID